jgi:hypothetical protein
MTKVSLSSSRPETRVDADEEETDIISDEVVNGLISEGFQLVRSEPGHL